MTLALHIVAFILWYSFVIVVGTGLICLALSPFVLAFQLVSTALAILYFLVIGVLCVITLPVTWLVRLRNRNARTFCRWYIDRRYHSDCHQTAKFDEPSRQRTQRPRSQDSESPILNATHPFDPYQILGVPRDVSSQALTKAYREKMQMNHPDKVAALDPALQTLATARTQMIGRAYRQILES